MELKIVADLGDVERLFARYPEAARKASERRVTEALLLLQAEVKRETPEGAGPIHLRDTIFHQVHAEGTPVWGLLGTPAIYGEAVELGTKPHFPPVGPILHWVEKKLGYSGKEAKSFAYAIVQAIGKRGTPRPGQEAARMFGKTLAKHEKRVISILRKIPSDIAAEVGEK